MLRSILPWSLSDELSCSLTSAGDVGGGGGGAPNVLRSCLPAIKCQHSNTKEAFSNTKKITYKCRIIFT